MLDGGSTDGTVELAQEFGCRVIRQDPLFLGSDGRIVDYAGITNQGIAAAGHAWVLIHSADEILTPPLQQSCMETVRRNQPGAFLFTRMYLYHNRLILHASSYPNEQVRLFHKESVPMFTKIIHERPVFAAGVKPVRLEGVQIIPLSDDFAALKRKYRRYIDLEIARFGDRTFRQWLLIVRNRLLSVAYRFFKVLRIRLRHRWSTCLPLRQESVYFWYAFRLIVLSFPRRNPS